MYDEARINLEEFVRKDGSTVVPGGGVLVWPGIPRAQHISDTLPAWSLHGRKKRDVFAEWIFDRDIQCPKGNADNSVCLGGTAVNPWLGGDFNPWERCDTEVMPDTSERISISCHPLACQSADAPYYTYQPNPGCMKRDEELDTSVHEANVPSTYESNLCKRLPAATGEVCEWEQGMMQGSSRGESLKNLYQETSLLYNGDTIAKEGQGLFYKGGNPMYHTPRLDSIQNR